MSIIKFIESWKGSAAMAVLLIVTPLLIGSIGEILLGLGGACGWAALASIEYVSEEGKAELEKQEPAEQEPICLDRGHRNWKKKTGEECTCRKYVPYANPLLSAVPDGWQLVPKEPTAEMLLAMAVIVGGSTALQKSVWSDALSAAPKEVK